MDDYSSSARAYLARARKKLSLGTKEALFYAAFEIRCGVEARLQEYLEPHEHIPESRRTDWRVGKLHRTANEAFQLGDQVSRLDIVFETRSDHPFTFYYTPVTSRLKAIVERLGNYLHAAQGPREKGFWDQVRDELAEAIQLLEDATTGTLLGPVLLSSESGNAVMPMELLPDIAGALPPIDELRGSDMVVNIRYFPDLASARSAT